MTLCSSKKRMGTALTLRPWSTTSPHCAFGTFIPDSSAGGCVVLVARALVDAAEGHCFVDVLSGRCCILNLHLNDYVMQFVNVHIEPKAELEHKKRLVRDIKARIVDSDAGISFMGGDFNFVPVGEERYQHDHDHDPNTYHHTTDPIATYFNDQLQSMTEIAQDGFTRLHIEHGALRSAARLDRWYSNMPEVDLADANPRAAVLHNLFKSRELSDHAPVSVIFEAPSVTPPPGQFVPEWVIHDDEFKVAVEQIMQEMPMADTVFEELEYMKEAMYIAAELVKEKVQERRRPQCAEEHIYWALLLWRGDRAGLPALVEKAVRADPSLEPAVDPEGRRVADRRWLRAHIVHLQDVFHQMQVDRMIHDPIHNNSKHDKKAAALQRALRRGRLWKPIGRAIFLQGIVSPDGGVLSGDAAAEELARHWGGQFTARPGNPETFEQFSNFVQPVPEGITWRATKEQLKAMLPKLRRSAPGPDGIPYAAWQVLGDAGLDLLWRLYEAVLDGASAPSWFNASVMAFLAKGDEDGDDDMVTRTPATTRPLSLADTCQKIVAKLVDSSMAVVATRTVAREQCGFVRGRRISDAVLALEAAGIASTIEDPEDPGLVFLDQRAAFPSVARNFLFWVLRRMGIPEFILVAVLALYSDNIAVVRFGASRAFTFVMEQGIRQGCPLSGTLWALMFDPVVRMLASRLDYKSSRLSAYADDLAFALHSLRRCMPILAAAIAEAGLSTMLELNFGKTVVVPLFNGPLNAVKRLLVEVAPCFSEAKVELLAKYLGVLVGPGAKDKAWTQQLLKFRARGHRVRACCLPLPSAIACYNIYAYSVLSHVAQFRASSPELEVAEAGVLATVTASPKNALSRDCLTHLRLLGFKVKVTTARALTIAARCRVVMASSSHAAAQQLISEALDSDDALMVPPTGWRRESIIEELQAAYDHVHRIRSIDIQDIASTKPHMLLKVVATASDNINYDIHDFIVRRVAWWLGVDVGSKGRRRKEQQQVNWDRLHQQAGDIIRACTAGCKVLPCHVVAAYVKSLANAWVTSSRMGGTTKACVFGCGCATGDGIKHLLTCPALFSAAAPYMPAGHDSWPSAPALRQMLLLDNPTSTTAIVRMIWHDVAMYSSNLLRRRPADLQQVVTARVRALCRESSVLKCIMKEYRRPSGGEHHTQLLDW